jgi:hypothetical protein
MIIGEVACAMFVIAGARVGAAGVEVMAGAAGVEVIAGAAGVEVNAGAAGVDVIAGAAGVGVPAAAAFCALAGVAVRRVAPSRPELSKP